MDMNYDVIVLGSGPGGYSTAIRASQLGLKTAIVEKSDLGGICLNWGCIPTKVLLQSASLYRHILDAEKFGIDVAKPSFKLEKIVKRSRDISHKLSSGVGYLLKKNKVTIVKGEGKLLAKKDDKVHLLVRAQQDTTFITKHLIIATGARARVLNNMEPDGKKIWNYRHALVPKKLPKHMVVMGSGAIGIEFADFYNTLGTKVIVVELMDRIVPVEDKDISANLQTALEKKGIEFLTSTKVETVNETSDGLTITLNSKAKKNITINTQILLSAIGIVGNVENIGLEELGVKIKNSHIVVGDYSRTSVEGIYAIGDVSSNVPFLAHKASHEGIICVEKIAGKSVQPFHSLNVPATTYTSPQIASIGLTEQQAFDQQIDIKVGKFPLLANGKAIIVGEDKGFVKIIFAKKTGELLGAHMIGPEVSEMIQGFSVAKTLETTDEDLVTAIFPHPTVSESMIQAVMDSFKMAIDY